MLLVLFYFFRQLSAQDTLNIMAYNVLDYGSGCQGSDTYLHQKLKTIVQYTNPDVLGMVKVHYFKTSSSDNPGGSPGPNGFADSILTFAMNAAYPGKYQAAPVTDACEHTANFDKNMDILFYNQNKLGFVSVVTLIKDSEDFDLYRLYYKDPNLSTTHDTTYLYFVLNHTVSNGNDANPPDGRDHQDSMIVKKLSAIFYHLPNLVNMGDFNTHTSTEPGYELYTLTSDTSFKFYDPPFFPDQRMLYPLNWNNDGSVTAYMNCYTRESATTPNSCGSSGAADQMFLHQLLSPWVEKGVDFIKYVPYSYKTLGNNGNRYNIDVNDSTTNGKNTSAPSSVLNAEYFFSDKYPLITRLAVTYNTMASGPANPLISVNTITTQPANASVCVAGNTSFSVLVTGYGVNYQWQVNTGSGFQNISNGGIYSGAQKPVLSISGATSAMNGYTYRCIVSANTTQTTASAALTVSIPAVSTTVSNASCFGGANGIATSTPSGGISPYSYTWTNGSTSQTAAVSGSSFQVSGLTSGTYSVTVTDATGCIEITTTSIAQPSSSLVAFLSGVSPTCGNSNGQVNVSASGATPGYSYFWSPVAATSPTVSSLQAGNYSVTVTDSQGCTAVSTIALGNSPGPALAVQSIANTTCSNESTGSFTVITSSGTLPYSYNWSPGVSGSTSEVIGSDFQASDLPQGSYSVTVTDANACIASTSAIIGLQYILSPGFSYSSVVLACTDTARCKATATVSGGTAPYSFQWSDLTSSASDSILIAGTYSVTVTDASGCSTKDSLTILLSTFTITAPLADSAGSITPAGSSTLTCADSLSYTITPKADYVIASVYIDSVSIGPASSYKFSTVSANHSIYATFSYLVPLCPTDINNDGITNNADFLLLLSRFNTTCNGCPEDINKDGYVNNSDFLILLGKFNQICE